MIIKDEPLPVDLPAISETNFLKKYNKEILGQATKNGGAASIKNGGQLYKKIVYLHKEWYSICNFLQKKV